MKILLINDEEQKLLLADLHEMVIQDDTYDKDVADHLYYKVLYAVEKPTDGKHVTE